jgi:protein-disulfide isomerase
MKSSIPKVFIILVAISMVLAACIPSPTAAPTAVPVLPTASSATAAPVAAQPTAVPTLGPAECKAGASAVPPATAEQTALVANVPSVNDTDLVRGPSDATVTILEYSDYQ